MKSKFFAVAIVLLGLLVWSAGSAWAKDDRYRGKSQKIEKRLHHKNFARHDDRRWDRRHQSWHRHPAPPARHYVQRHHYRPRPVHVHNHYHYGRPYRGHYHSGYKMGWSFCEPGFGFKILIGERW